MFSTDFRIATDSAQCGYIHVVDVSTYPISGETILTTARALFYSTDNFTTVLGGDLNNPGDNTTVPEWLFSVNNGNTYTVRAFLVNKYDDTEAFNYIANDICYYNGDFYINSSGGPINSIGVAFVPGDWTVLTVVDYSDFENAFVIGTEDYGYSEDNEIINFSNYKIVKDSCYNYTITDNSGRNVAVLCTIMDYSLTTSYASFYIPAGGSGTIDLETLGLYDGVYVLSLSQLGYDTEYLIIYEFCKLQSCYDKLIKFILCNNDEDPCCTKCDEDDERKKVMYRDELNKLLALYLTLLSMIHVQEMQYLRNYTEIYDRREKLGEVMDLITKILDIVNRCGACTDEELASNSNIITLDL